MLTRLEFKDGYTDKFWEIDVNGKNFRISYGPIGESGETLNKEFESPEKAQKDADKRIKGKLKKGYLPAGQAAPEDEDDFIVAPPNPELEQQAAQEGLKSDAMAVYADYLQSQNDSMGEPIARYIAGKRVTSKEITEMLPLKLHRPLNQSSRYARSEVPVSLGWEGPFISSGWFGTSEDFNGPPPQVNLELFWNQTCGKFMERLSLGLADTSDGEADFQPSLKVLLDSGPRPALKDLSIGSFDEHEWQISWTNVGDVGPLLPLYPNLKELYIQGCGVYLSDAKHDTLEKLTIRSGGLPGDCVKSLAKANFPKLKRLAILFGMQNYGGGGTMEILKPLLSNKNLPKLKELTLGNSEFQNQIAAEVVTSPLLKKLNELGLSMGMMTDEGAQALLDAEENLKHLKEIWVERNFLSPEMCKKLTKAFGKKISVSPQRDPEEDGEYTSVAE